MDVSKIHAVAIYPAIGIARVGNSPDDYFFDSLIPVITAKDKDDFRDDRERFKRQAAIILFMGSMQMAIFLVG